MNSEKKIVMCGCHEAGYHLVSNLLRSGIRFSWFVTITEETARLSGVAGYKSFEPLASEYNIPVYHVNKYSLKDEKDLAFFQREKFDLLIQGGWQRLFPEEILRTLSVGGIGIHGSSDFLPQGKGRSPINWSLIEGKKRFIMQYFLMKPGVDDGDVFHYEIFDINDWDDCNTLYYKNSIVSYKTLTEFIPKLLTSKVPLFKQEGPSTFYPKRTPSDGLIDWTKSVFEIFNFIRALTKPYPGAFTFIDNKKVTIWKAQPFDTKITYWGAKPGEIVEVFSGVDYLVNCNSGLLLITQSDLIAEVGCVFDPIEI
ncbi:MAG: formyltransferase family protein [Bacteroidota bacterium]